MYQEKIKTAWVLWLVFNTFMKKKHSWQDCLKKKIQDSILFYQGHIPNLPFLRQLFHGPFNIFFLIQLELYHWLLIRFSIHVTFNAVLVSRKTLVISCSKWVIKVTVYIENLHFLPLQIIFNSNHFTVPPNIQPHNSPKTGKKTWIT